MEPKLVTFDECSRNIHLFTKMNPSGIDKNLTARIVVYSNNEPWPWRFSWYVNGDLHRLDGPATLSEYSRGEWYFLGEPVCVYTQSKFDEWVVNKVREMTI